MTEQSTIKTYTTESGDTWDMIAYKTMEDVYNTDLLIKANIEYAHIAVFSAGIELIIPAEDENERTIDSALPPWKLVDYDEEADEEE